MSTSKRYSGHWGCIDIMSKPWFIDVLTFGVVGLWLMLTYATIQQFGPSPQLLSSSIIMIVAALFLIYGQRIRYLRLGDWLEFDTRKSVSRNQDDNE